MKNDAHPKGPPLKVESSRSTIGPHGEHYLVAGRSVAMRLWKLESPDTPLTESVRDYEVLGYVLEGRAELYIEGQRVGLAPGDSYWVPKGARHYYRIVEAFSAVEATAPSSHPHYEVK